jgi:hypothetical protein
VRGIAFVLATTLPFDTLLPPSVTTLGVTAAVGSLIWNVGIGIRQAFVWRPAASL